MKPDLSIEAKICNFLSSSRKTLAVSESCTGGLLAHRLTNIPGASAYFLGGVVAYANKAKISLLGVQADSLIRYGAVSSTIVYEMAKGTQTRFGSQYALAISGIAGPTGGSAAKPIGTICYAIATPHTITTGDAFLPDDRLAFKERAVSLVLEKFWHLLLNEHG